MKIKSLFLICAIAIAVVVSTLFTRVTFLDLQAYRASKDSERCLALVSAALAVMEKISLERAPTNSLLGESKPHQSERLSALAQARKESDRTISQLQELLSQASMERQNKVSVYLASTIEQLHKARNQVDVLADRPLADRSSKDIRSAVMNMIRTVAEIRPAVVYLGVETTQLDPTLSPALTSAFLAAELREYAGQLGSQITAALARGQPLTDTEIRDIDHLTGCIEILHELLQQHIRQFLQTSEVIRRMEEMSASYFGDGMQLLQETIDRSRKPGAFNGTPYDFAREYVPRMAPILGVRDIALKEAARQVQERQFSARQNLFHAATGYALLLFILSVMLLYIGRRVMQAISTTTQVIVSIAGGKLDTDVPTVARRDEIGDMLRSIQILKEESVKRKQAEEAREALVLQLQDALANVRTLSGLLPICAHCKKVRDDKGYWNQIEVYVRKHSEAQFSHGICPQCMKELYNMDNVE